MRPNSILDAFVAPLKAAGPSLRRNESGATMVEYAIVTAVLVAFVAPAAAFITTAIQNRIADAEKIHDGWCIPDPVNATIAAKCN